MRLINSVHSSKIRTAEKEGITEIQPLGITGQAVLIYNCEKIKEHFSFKEINKSYIILYLDKYPIHSKKEVALIADYYDAHGNRIDSETILVIKHKSKGIVLFKDIQKTLREYEVALKINSDQILNNTSDTLTEQDIIELQRNPNCST